MPRPIACLRTEAIADEVLRLAAVASCELDRVADRVELSAHWSTPPLVIVDDPSLCHGLPKRDGVLVLHQGPPPPAFLSASFDAGATRVLCLPDDTPWLSGALADAAESLPGQAGPVIAVIGGTGGAGTSTFAAALALTAATTGTTGTPTLLLDCDPLSGGMDLLLGAENTKGLRWPDITLTSGRISAKTLTAALPAATLPTPVLPRFPRPSTPRPSTSRPSTSRPSTSRPSTPQRSTPQPSAPPHSSTTPDLHPHAPTPADLAPRFHPGRIHPADLDPPFHTSRTHLADRDSQFRASRAHAADSDLLSHADPADPDPRSHTGRTHRPASSTHSDPTHSHPTHHADLGSHLPSHPDAHRPTASRSEGGPRHARLTILSGATPDHPPTPEAITAVISAARRAGNTVICDLPRHPTPATQAALIAATLTAVVVPSDVRACAAAHRMIRHLRTQGITPHLIIRGPSPSRLTPREIARSLNTPLLAHYKSDRSLPTSLDKGTFTPRASLTRAARTVLSHAPT